MNPELERVHLVDYKVRIINSAAGSDAGVRVLVESSDGLHLWRTVGVFAHDEARCSVKRVLKTVPDLPKAENAVITNR